MLVVLKSLLVFSTTNKNCFFTEFHEKFNIIKGKNTSGKSTLIQSIIYAFGINDGKEKLEEILKNNLIFKLDLVVNNDLITLIRDSDSYYIVKNKSIKKRFDGINSNNSNEHIKLKKELSELFNFNLFLERKGELVSAPLEVMWLPSYISQAVGWVYLRESFSNLSYYKDFKEDYLDYHLGIIKGNDRTELHRLKLDMLKNNKEIDFLKDIGVNNNEIIVSRLMDEKYIHQSSDYLKDYEKLCDDLIFNESRYIELCNLKSLEIERKRILNKIKKNINNQRPEYDSCPVCVQSLPSSLSDIYTYYQKINNTHHEISSINEMIKKRQSQLNSVLSNIERITENIDKKYNNLNTHINYEGGVSFDRWIENKVNISFFDKIHSKIGDKEVENSDISSKINNFPSEENIIKSRSEKESAFYSVFLKYLNELKVTIPREQRYTKLYSINSFPFQGVELHKTVLAYHFAFNEILSNTDGIAKFPLLLDAIMKEDIDEDNRKLIFSFISRNSSKTKQVIFSVSESLKDSENSINTTNINIVQKNYFRLNSKIIQIGDGNSERSFLNARSSEFKGMIDQTLEIINEIF